MNRPTVNNPEAVHRILEQFHVRPELQVASGDEAGKSELTFVSHKEMEVEWPCAIRANELPVEPDSDEWDEAVEYLCEQCGQQGFADLLLALAPYLNSPLVLQAASFSSAGEFYRAKEWTVRPGATEVEVKEIEGMDHEHSIVSSD